MVSTRIHTCGSSRTKGSSQATKRGDHIVKNDSLIEEDQMPTHSERVALFNSHDIPRYFIDFGLILVMLLEHCHLSVHFCCYNIPKLT